MVKKKAKKKVIKSKIVEGTNGHHRRIPGWFIFPSGEVVEISPSAAHEDSAYDNYPGVVCARVWAYGQGYKITEDTLMCLSHIPYRGRIKEAIRKWASDVITKWPDLKNIKVSTYGGMRGYENIKFTMMNLVTGNFKSGD